MVKNLNKLAREIIETNQYVTIASANKHGEPWISPVVYSYDKNWDLYFVSIPSSKHCQNFHDNQKVSLAIFDSHQLWGEGVGLQIEAACSEVTPQESHKALTEFFKRKFPYGNPSHNPKEYVEQFTNKDSKYRCYKISLQKVWMNDPNNKEDARVEIEL